MIDKKNLITNGDCVEEGEENDLFFKEIKVLQIEKALRSNDRLSLKTLAISNHGFLTNELRVQAWCLLANVDRVRPTNSESLPNQLIPQNENYRQVILDVERSLKRFPPSVKESARLSYQNSLTNVIIKVLDRNPSFYYYQGYHDICLTFLLIMNEEDALNLIDKVSNSSLKYFMERTMNTTSKLLEIIYLILKQEDPELHDYLIKSEVGTIFSLSWVITWFSHVLNDLDDILRLFDFFIASHFVMPIYMTVSILLYKKEEILQIDCDMASMHKYLTSIPHEEPLPIDQLVRDTLKLSVKHPPEDTLLRQKQLEQKALTDDVRTFSQTIGNLSRQIFSITIIGIITVIVYQVYCKFDYLY